MIIFVLVVLGHRSSSAFLIAAAVFIAIAILKSNVSDAFYWSLVLIPNIRMLDGIGTTFIVNALMALPLIVYFLRRGIKRIYAVALFGSIALCLMEFLHDLVLCDMGNLVSIAAWSLNILLCILVTVDNGVTISKNDVFSAFSTGIILSAAMYLGSGLETVSHIMSTLTSGARFTAFADDPNYYSLYICLTIACILNVTGKNLYKFCVMILLVGIGLLTASKMCIILMVFEFILIFIQIFNSNRDSVANRKFIMWSSAGAIVVLFALRDYIAVFVNNFIRRMGNIGTQGFDLAQLTTGRTTIMAEYVQIFFDNIVCFLFGYGFNYHLFLGQSTGHGAHNTYLDLLLAWGVVGTVLFLAIMYGWIKSFRTSRSIVKLSAIKILPIFILLINFLDLSCLSASMFPFVISVGLIQWLPAKREDA